MASSDNPALSNDLILEKVFSWLPLKQLKECRLVSQQWNTSASRQTSSKARIDLTLCRIGEEKQKLEVEEKLDAIFNLRIATVQLGGLEEQGIEGKVSDAFRQAGQFLTKLTLKFDLEKEQNFADFQTLLRNCPSLTEFDWWGSVDENLCRGKENYSFPSIKSLNLGFYPAEVNTMGKRAILWVSNIFPNVNKFGCLPKHREGVIPHLLQIWGEGTPAFPHLSALTLHFHLLTEDEESGRIQHLLNLPSGLTSLNITLNGKLEKRRVQDFGAEEGQVFSQVLQKVAGTLEYLTINFVNLWKPKPVVRIELPNFPKLKRFSVTSDFKGDLCIDLGIPSNATFPRLQKLHYPYLNGQALNRFLTIIDGLEFRTVRITDLALSEKSNDPWVKKQPVEWIPHFKQKLKMTFPNAEI